MIICIGIMKVQFEIDKKTLALAKAHLLQSAEDEKQEKKIETACSRCEGGAVVEVGAADVGKKNVKQLLLGLAFIAIAKMADDSDI